MKRLVLVAAWMMALALSAHAAGDTLSGLADATVLIVRHGEKPDSGTGLSPAGEARAQAYVAYFQPFMLDGTPVRPDMLVASADSKNSARERLTLTPLAQALKLPIDQRFADKDVKGLVAALASETHGKSILIAWHHGQLSKLIKAFGVYPNALLPNGKWPRDVFNWVVVLRFDHAGQLVPGSTRIIEEKLPG
ncbi:flagellar basal body-associated protein FliL [Mesorhizobium sp. BH1-1-4]|uniref:flagellar basal body-associated protein FliL n=1 Tax=Mesorhizobium sp. BH1-1-4 TaxID=2876662 RepID=UPI001CD148CC|nr:flagellar basal body-associated protein FliL [Mesorhizobium sp. BH1-1-4]MBZ9995769.1 flagellar basal body-associated protein FliL [Mesorhizobium sp. BH1-1-4]